MQAHILTCNDEIFHVEILDVSNLGKWSLSHDASITCTEFLNWSVLMICLAGQGVHISYWPLVSGWFLLVQAEKMLWYSELEWFCTVSHGSMWRISTNNQKLNQNLWQVYYVRGILCMLPKFVICVFFHDTLWLRVHTKDLETGCDPLV